MIRQQRKQKHVLNYKNYIADSILNFSFKGQMNINLISDADFSRTYFPLSYLFLLYRCMMIL